jgi:hypothetical protein
MTGLARHPSIQGWSPSHLSSRRNFGADSGSNHQPNYSNFTDIWRTLKRRGPLPASRSKRGLIQASKLRERINLKLIPMVNLESGESGQGTKCPGGSNHADGGNPLSVLQIDTTPLKTKVYKGSSLGQIEDGWYYIPESKNQVAFDSFIMAEGNLYISQCSTTSDHLIKGGILPFFSQDSLASCIRNDGSEIRYPQPRNSQASLKELPVEMGLYTVAPDVARTPMWYNGVT